MWLNIWWRGGQNGTRSIATVKHQSFNFDLVFPEWYRNPRAGTAIVITVTQRQAMLQPVHWFIVRSCDRAIARNDNGGKQRRGS